MEILGIVVVVALVAGGLVGMVTPPRQQRGVRQLPRVGLQLGVALAVVVVVGVAALVFLPRWAPLADPAALGTTKVILSILGGLGAVFLGVYSYRKQHLEELGSQRADLDQYLSRYNAAADQLGHEQPAVRLAGVYAMARLADDWPEQRQQAVDVLCAYLRMKPPTDPDEAAKELEVRTTIQNLIRDHTRLSLDHPHSWSALDYNLAGATLHNLDMSGTTINGSLNLNGATFNGDAVFWGATFAGGAVFGGATFAGDAVFWGATFAGDAGFERATFAGYAGFGDATFNGRAGFGDATFNGDAGFRDATFNGDAGFGDATFNGDAVFGGATFSRRVFAAGVSWGPGGRPAGFPAPPYDDDED